MGSDNQEKGSLRTWGKLKVALVLLTSCCLVARVALSDGALKFASKPATSNSQHQHKAAPPPTPPPAPVRPEADSPHYDPYFVNVANDFTVASDFDFGKLLHKQGFRVTKDKAKEMLGSQMKRSLSEALLLSHDGIMSADWASHGVEAVPVLHHAIINSNRGSFPDQATLQAKLESLSNHEFVLEISSVAMPRRTTTGHEKYIFAYDNHTWQMDSLNPIKFINLLEFFAERTFRGAFIKETLNFKQTGMMPMMPQDEHVDSSVRQSFVLMPRFFSPKELRDACTEAASDRITENLDQPIELKVLVLWGQAYMATCYSPICNPFAGPTYTPAQGPRYVVYPDGKSQFLEETAKSPGEIKCAQAIDAYIKSKLEKTLETAEKVAQTLGAPWLRVDMFMDAKAKNGAFLHRVRSADTAVSGWVKRSERAMAVVARGFESRSRVRGYPQPKTKSSQAALNALGCIVEPEGYVECAAAKSPSKTKSPPKTKSPVAAPRGPARANSSMTSP